MRTGNPWAAFQVKTECDIDGASKNKTGNSGRADICYREGNKLFVWEVKSVGVANTGKGELADYIKRMKQDTQYKGLDIVQGFDLSMPAVGYVNGRDGGRYVTPDGQGDNRLHRRQGDAPACHRSRAGAGACRGAESEHGGQIPGLVAPERQQSRLVRQPVDA
ncbi:hypothetical protein ACWCPX_23450 [Streptomyces olivaceoviridis]